MHVVIPEEKICNNLENSLEYHQACLFFGFISAIGKSLNLGSTHFFSIRVLQEVDQYF